MDKIYQKEGKYPCIKYRLSEDSQEILHPISSAPCYDEFEVEQEDGNWLLKRKKEK